MDKENKQSLEKYKKTEEFEMCKMLDELVVF